MSAPYLCNECRCDLPATTEQHEFDGMTMCRECAIEYCKHIVLQSFRVPGSAERVDELLSEMDQADIDRAVAEMELCRESHIIASGIVSSMVH